MTQLQNYLVLNTGAMMPVIGLGTWKAPADQVGKAVEYALSQAGYRHVDCAAIYLNEPEIGQVFSKVFSSGPVKREEVFITSKLWNYAHRKSDVLVACKQTLKDLQLDYLDLYLMHWGVAVPSNVDGENSNHRGEPLDNSGYLVTNKVSIRETWEAMETLVDHGLVRAIGVSNFTTPMIIDLLTYARSIPAVNQIELHPYNVQSRLVEFCQHHNIAVTGYSSLGSPGNMKGKPILIEDVQILEIARKHGRTPAQVLLRWGIERGTVVLTKSTTPERISENLGALDFRLTQEDMQAIARLDRKYRYVDPY